MGTKLGTMTDSEEQQLRQELELSEDQLRIFYDNFASIGKREKGKVFKDELLTKLKISNEESEFVGKVLDLFIEESDKKEINFINMMSVLHDFDKQDKDKKLKWLFRLLDSDKNGLLGAKELALSFKMVETSNIPEKELFEIAEQTVIFADKNKDGFIDFEEFKEFYNSVLQITI